MSSEGSEPPPSTLDVPALGGFVAVPADRWAVGVSGGADSVALLLLLRARRQRQDPRQSREPANSADPLHLHVAHLDHQTRGDASAADARFVRALATGWNLPCTIARRDEFEVAGPALPPNPSARYRALRHELFRRVCAAHRLRGVILAHHADDQAETVLHRLLRGSSPAGLVGMRERTEVGGLTILRPLLQIRREALRRLLLDCAQPWREDTSNASDQYLRNRLRRFLADHPALTDDLLSLSAACRGVRDWVRSAAPTLEESFAVAKLGSLPSPLARESASRWLLARGVSPDALHRAPTAIDRLMALAADACTASRQDFPGGVRVRRRGGRVSTE